MYGDDRKPKMRLDISKVSMVNDVSVGDVVSVTVTGKVCRIEGTTEYEDYDYKPGVKEPKKITRTSPGTLEIEATKIKVAGSSEFDDGDEY